VTISSGFGRQVRELHGKALAQHYRDCDDRKAMVKRLGEEFMAKVRERQG
jgi:hypothetical protein